MQVIDYEPQHFAALLAFADRLGTNLNLSHRPFVDHYYGSKPWCRLRLCVEDKEGIVATFGVERLRFEYHGREMFVGLGSNFYSLRPGTGGILFVRCLQSVPIGLVFGGSADTHKLIRSRKWNYFNGIKECVLNKPYDPYPGQTRLKLKVKGILRRILRSQLSTYARRIPAEVRRDLSVHEEREYSEELLPRDAPFTFRFAPTLEYLRWRYNLELPYVRYRLFSVRRGRHRVGYVILNESPETVTVAHCDGSEARTLAYGVLCSILELGRDDREPRTVYLASSHGEMQRIYEGFGFRPIKPPPPFALGALQGPADIELDTSNWLVNMDWGDNVLRPPFLDQRQAEPPKKA